MRKKYRRRDVVRALVPPLMAARMLAVDEEARARARLEALIEAQAGLDEIEVAALALRDVQAGMRGLGVAFG